MIEEGSIGRVTHVDANMSIGDVMKPEKGWRYDKALSGGGVLIDFGIHMLDLLYWYFGKAKVVEASMEKIYSKQVEDAVSAKLEFDYGIDVHFSTTWSSKNHRKSYSKMRIEGKLGVIEVTDQTLTLIDLNSNIIDKFSQPQLQSGVYYDIGGAPFSNQTEYFISLLNKNVGNLESLSASIDVQELIEQIYAKANQTIEVKNAG